MSVRVRFAPSPTGLLHIGNARTAIYNYLYAKAKSGTLILRVEDTDSERSTKEFEVKQREDLAWLGLAFDEGPEIGGDYGPYRQSERLHIYREWAQKLIGKGQAFHCFCTEDELTARKEKSLAEGGAGHYDGTCRRLTESDVKNKSAQGLKSVVRFCVPHKAYDLHDHVRSLVHFPADMVGDFVLIRSDGIPVYNYAVVVDDILMKITHVIRGEDHLNNTVRQLMIYEAFGAKAPEFAHASLLIGKDRQKLSKRHGATSVCQYREDNYLPESLVNYLCLLGWSHPEEKDVFDLVEAAKHFDMDRLNDSPAVYDLEKLAYINGQHLRAKSNAQIVQGISACVDPGHAYHRQTQEWKERLAQMAKRDMHFYKDIASKLELIFEVNPPKDAEFDIVNGWPSTDLIRKFLREKLAHENGDGFLALPQWEALAADVKAQLKLKGKELFQGMRLCLTCQAHGPDLKELIPLTSISILKQRLA